jgi:hypothetical protein
MKRTIMAILLPVTAAAAGALLSDNFGLLALAVPFIFAHCDTMGGPVISEAKRSLKSGDITPLLKWVRAEDEALIQETFQKALRVRALNTDAAELADRLFFETLVRVHRAAEGAPFTGLKPEGEGISPIELAADRAIEEGSVAPLAEKVGSEVSDAITARFERVRETKKRADESVQAGREYVEAYVDYVHFVDGLHDMISGHGGAGHHAGHGDAGHHEGHA